MEVFAIALQGLQQADAQLDTAAARIASAGAATDENVDVVNLSAELVALMTAQLMFSANLATLKTADQMHRAVVDIRS